MTTTIETTTRQQIKDRLTKDYFDNIPSKYDAFFRAVQNAYDKEYPLLKKAAASAESYTITWQLDKSECKRGLKEKTDEIEKKVRSIYAKIESVQLKSAVLSEMFEKQIINFEANRYEDSQCPNRHEHIKQMNFFKEMVDKVHVLITSSLPKLNFLGNNLLHILKEGREMDYRERNIYFGSFSDIHQLSSFTSKEEPKKESYASVLKEGQQAQKPHNPPLVSGKGAQ